MQADKKQVMRLLKTSRGQIDGLIKMVEDDRYCIDIAHQLLAAEAILKKVNRLVLKAHLERCVAEAVGENGEEKIAELSSILNIWEKI